MKEKQRIIMKVAIIVVAVIAGLIIVQALYQIIGMTLLSYTPKSDVLIKIEKYIEEYNRSCDANKQVKIDHYYENGPHIRCNLKFNKDFSADDESITTFFLTFHNDFGYENFCNEDINSDFFRKYDEVIIEIENIRINYGDKKTLTYPLAAGLDPENIDASIFGVGKTVVFEPDIISKFKGTINI